MGEVLENYWAEITAWSAFVTVILTGLTIAWVLTIKREPMSALAWCLVVFFLPLIGMLLFVLLGYQQVHRPVSRKARHKREYRQREGFELDPETLGEAGGDPAADSWQSMARLAERFDAFAPCRGNRFTFYYDGQSAYDAKLEAIRAARHHIHLEYFIFQPDAIGQEFLKLLEEKVRQGVEVRLVYDAMGSRRLHRWHLRALRAAGGQCRSFLPLDPLRRHIQINMRNHRKILVVDGKVAFTGGLNIGDEYLGKLARFGPWRDTHLRVEGPLVASLQRVFVEDWDFASGESLKGRGYFPKLQIADSRLQIEEKRETEPPAQETKDKSAIECIAQVIHSGPDQEIKSIREIYFAAIFRARQRLWIASPYFVPDAGLRDALCMAGYQGIDVRLLCQFHPDKWVPYYAGRFYLSDMLDAGVKVYQYTRGMMHAKVMLMDGAWASVGTANLDNRSLYLNFEVNCLIYSHEAVAELEQSFCRDFQDAIQLERDIFNQRPYASRLVENACRLMSPVL
jgi:cardiolipin synthase